MSDTIAALERTIADRKQHPKEGSYTCALFEAGDRRILKKVGEESAEVIVAAALEDKERLASETADLVYHLLVMLAAHDMSWDDVKGELEARFK